MTKPSWPIAFVALLLTCVLLTGFLPHEPEDGDVAGDHHHCVTCCLAHFAAITSTVTAATTDPDIATPTVAATSRGMRPAATPGIHPTRGPPA